MTLLQLDITSFRCISHTRMEFSPRQNLIIGSNASGKTSLLEAIFLLGTGHSFRTHQTDLLIQHGASDFLLVARIEAAFGTDAIGIRGSKRGKELRVNGEEARSLSDLVRRLPVQVIDPDVHRLLEDGPIRRRRFMDWGVFHVEPGFYLAWRRYQKVLRQRNAALRMKQPASTIRIWDQELVDQGTLVTGFREQYISQLRPLAKRLGQHLLGLDLDLEHFCGWRNVLDLATALNESLSRDQQRGTTSVGPHRADLILKVGGAGAKDRISRGQQKMLACALILAQQTLRAAKVDEPACLLVDDPAAELDIDNLRKLLIAIVATPGQLVVTSLTDNMATHLTDPQLFHVEHGVVRAVA